MLFRWPKKCRLWSLHWYFFYQIHFWKRKIVPCIDRSSDQWGENRSVRHFDQQHRSFSRTFVQSVSVLLRKTPKFSLLENGKPLNLVFWYSKNIGKTNKKHAQGTWRLNQSIDIFNEKKNFTVSIIPWIYFEILDEDFVRVCTGVLYLPGTRLWKVVTQVYSDPSSPPCAYVTVGCADFDRVQPKKRISTAIILTKKSTKNSPKRWRGRRRPQKKLICEFWSEFFVQVDESRFVGCALSFCTQNGVPSEFLESLRGWTRIFTLGSELTISIFVALSTKYTNSCHVVCLFIWIGRENVTYNICIVLFKLYNFIAFPKCESGLKIRTMLAGVVGCLVAHLSIIIVCFEAFSGVYVLILVKIWSL